MNKKLPLLTFPLSIETLNRFGATLVINLLLRAAQLNANKCRVRVDIGEARNATERELGAGLLTILNDMPIKEGQRAQPTTARIIKRGNKP